MTCKLSNSFSRSSRPSKREWHEILFIKKPLLVPLALLVVLKTYIYAKMSATIFSFATKVAKIRWILQKILDFCRKIANLFAFADKVGSDRQKLTNGVVNKFRKKENKSAWDNGEDDIVKKKQRTELLWLLHFKVIIFMGKVI